MTTGICSINDSGIWSIKRVESVQLMTVESAQLMIGNLFN